MTLDDLKAHRFFRALHPPLDIFVLTYIQNDGNSEEASQAAFHTATKSASRTYAKRAFDNPIVARCLALWDGQIEEAPDCESFKIVLWQEIKKMKSGSAKADMFDLFANVSGWKTIIGNKAPAPPSSDILDSLDSHLA